SGAARRIARRSSCLPWGCVQLHRLLARTLAGTCIGTCALATDRQPAAMTDSPIGAEVHQALDVHGHFAAQVTLDCEFRNLRADGIHLRLGEVLPLRMRIHACAFASGPCTCPPDAVDVRQADPDVLVHRYVDASYTCHIYRPTMAAKKRGIVRVPEPITKL